MGTVKSLWTLLWTVTLVIGFGGLGVLGVGLIGGAIFLSNSIFWGIMIFMLGLLAVLVAIGAALTGFDRPGKTTA